MSDDRDFKEPYDLQPIQLTPEYIEFVEWAVRTEDFMLYANDLWYESYTPDDDYPKSKTTQQLFDYWKENIYKK